MDYLQIQNALVYGTEFIYSGQMGTEFIYSGQIATCDVSFTNPGDCTDFIWTDVDN